MNQQKTYQKIISEPAAVTWLDLLQGSFTNHSKRDYARAMQAGTIPSAVDRNNPLGSWRLPFLWWPLAKFSILLILGMYGLLYMLFSFGFSVSNTLGNMTMIIPPILIPLVILVFLWELNIPQDVSLMEMAAMFVVGGVLTFAANSLLFLVVTERSAVYAGLREEPAKLAASLAILLYLQQGRNRRINGFTGLMVGAAVGAAFSGFESVSYAINFSDSFEQMLNVQLTRALYAMGGHIAYCVPYSAAIGLKSKDGKITLMSIISPLTLFAFALSVGMHTMWNATNVTLIHSLLTIAGFFILQFWFRQCLVEYIGSGASAAEPGSQRVPVGSICLYITEGPMKGTSWCSTGDTVYLGRDRSKCRICFPPETHGVSKLHCCISKTSRGWVIQDLNSSFGTYLSGHRLPPQEAVPLKPGDIIYLGSKRIAIKVE